MISWTSEPGDLYIVTGVTVSGKRFAKVFHTWLMASGINLYRGSKWLVRGGKRKLIVRVYN